MAIKNKICVALLITVALSSCKKFLDEKPNKKWVVPSNLQDLSYLLDNTSFFNEAVSAFSNEIACDDYYLTNDDWQSTSNPYYRNSYYWQKDGSNNNDWFSPYFLVSSSNIILDQLAQFEFNPALADEWNRIQGAALFGRAFGFYEVAQVYAKGYDKNTSAEDLGVPLRLTSDFNIPSVRATVEETYQQIINDLKEAARLLPATALYKSRASKPAAFAMLARTYMTMQQYEKAGLYADSCLQLYNTLVDYNNVNASATTPLGVVGKYNDEVILYATCTLTTALYQSKCKIDSTLYNSYSDNDLRKTVFFRSNGNGTYAFKGGYDGHVDGKVFKGMTTDEMYLTRAEAKARAAQTNEAMNDLNTLLKKRWKTGSFTPMSAATPGEALSIILGERRKELIFRGIRWTDLRRLNKEPGQAITLTRVVNGQTYTLPPNSPAYVFLVPDYVMSHANLQQNLR